MKRLARYLTILNLGLALAMPGQAQPPARAPAQAASQAAAKVAAPLDLAGDALARYLVGTWTSMSREPLLNVAMEQTYLADGSFRGTISMFTREDASKDSWRLAGKVTVTGSWVIEGDVCVETVRTTSLPIMPLPSIDKDRLTNLQPGEFTSISVASGTAMLRQRKPQASAAHDQAFNQPWPEPAADAPWQGFASDAEGSQSYDAGSAQRWGDIVGVWMRADMSPQALMDARALAAKNTSGARPLILERVFSYSLIDCRQKWIKRREIRIYMDGQLAAASRYEGDDPTTWNRIEAEDTAVTLLAHRVCAAP